MVTIRVDGAQFQRQCYAEVYKGSGTCPYGTDKPPIKATFIAALRGETAPGQAWHRLAIAPRSIGPRAARLLTQTRPNALKGKAVTVSSRLFRSLRLLHNRQLTVLVYSPPAPQGESIIAWAATALRTNVSA